MNPPAVKQVPMYDERLSALDTAFLCLESAGAPLHLGALAVFEPDRPVTPDRLVEVLCARISRLPLLRQRVRPAWLPPGSAVWEEDGCFRPEQHLRVHRLDAASHDPDGPDLLAGLASDLMAEPLDLRRPLWQLHLVTGLPEGRFAVLVKLHHALADGLRAVEVGVGLLDGISGALPAALEPLALPTAPQPAPFLLDLARTAAGLATHPDRLLGCLARSSASIAGSLPGVVRQAADAAGIASSVLSSARLGALPATIARALPGGAPSTNLVSANPALAHRSDRGLALLRLDVGDVRQVRKQHGGTDNDVLLAVIAGALRDWLSHRLSHRPEAVNLRALIPVSRRSRADDRRRGNLLSGYLCDLPVQEKDPVARLHKIRTTMERNKAAGFGRGPGALPLLADRVPAAVHRVTAPLARRGANLLFDTMVTNVPIPALPLSLDGAKLREVYPIVPLAHGQAFGIALSSYQGRVHVGLHADRQAVPDLHRLAAALPAALASLTAASARTP
jgi:diacylglycerol O-acyltransferase / wax synthase